MGIKVGLYHGKSVTSKLIKYHSRGKYSHASLLFNDGNAIEAWATSPFGGEVFNVPRDAKHTEGTPVDIYTVVNHNPDWEAIRQFALDQVGKDYDWKMVWGFVTKRKNEPASSKQKWFCSELVFAALQAGGVDLFNQTHPHEVTPMLLSRSPHLEYTSTFLTQKWRT